MYFYVVSNTVAYVHVLVLWRSAEKEMGFYIAWMFTLTFACTSANLRGKS